jgi:hypothetical protein
MRARLQDLDDPQNGKPEECSLAGGEAQLEVADNSSLEMKIVASDRAMTQKFRPPIELQHIIW